MKAVNTVLSIMCQDLSKITSKWYKEFVKMTKTKGNNVILVAQQQILTAKIISHPDISDKPQIHSDPNSDSRVSVNVDIAENADSERTLIYDVNYSGIDDKFASSILHANQFKVVGVDNGGIDTEIHKKWRCQSLFDFGYIPIDEQLMPHGLNVN